MGGQRGSRWALQTLFDKRADLVTFGIAFVEVNHGDAMLTKQAGVERPTSTRHVGSGETVGRVRQSHKARVYH